MKKTYHGSCHCGAVAFEAEIDLAEGTGKCNCSICAKSRHWGVVVKPEAFRLLRGESELTDYQFATKSGSMRFCKKCGIRPFGTGNVPELGGAFVSVNLAALDDAEVSELMAGPIRYGDGLNNNWQNPPAEIRHL